MNNLSIHSRAQIFRSRLLPSLCPATPSPRRVSSPVAHHYKRIANCPTPTLATMEPAHPSEGVSKTPHSPFHYSHETHRRAFEGWYLRLTLDDGRSFAFIHCLEDPSGESEFSKASSQVMWGGGSLKPGYLLQYSRESEETFWARTDVMEFGSSYANNQKPVKKIIDEPNEFFNRVQTGFQASETLHSGCLQSSQPEGDILNSVLPDAKITPNSASHVSWHYNMSPIYGWGNTIVSKPQAAANGSHAAQQNIAPNPSDGAKSTAGFMAVSPLFDPQWQIVLAHATATGWVEMDGERIEFSNASAYVEKNWGNGFPSKWFWLQCNLFDDTKANSKYPDLTVTAVGSKKRTVQPAGTEVDVGLIGVHFNGEFIEIVPWNGTVEWEVKNWRTESSESKSDSGDTRAYWKIAGGSAEYHVEIEASAPQGEAPSWLLGPHETAGFVPFCRDAFDGSMRLKVWKKEKGLLATAAAAITGEGATAHGELVIDAYSSHGAAVECGGAPWDEHAPWKSDCKLPKAIAKALVNPIDASKLAEQVGRWLGVSES